MAIEIIVVIQLEGKKAINNLDYILKFDGIDVLFIGPYDLSQSPGFPGQIDHPLVLEAMNDIVLKARLKGIVEGTFTETLQVAGMWKKAGVQYISYSVDVGIFTNACTELAIKLNALE